MPAAPGDGCGRGSATAGPARAAAAISAAATEHARVEHGRMGKTLFDREPSVRASCPRGRAAAEPRSELRLEQPDDAGDRDGDPVRAVVELVAQLVDHLLELEHGQQLLRGL